jgi:hypothetical protein
MIMKKHSPLPLQTQRRSPSSIHQTILGFSIGVAGFFAGTLYTMHMGIGQHHDCSSSGSIDSYNENMAQQVEEAVQRRMRGT